MPLYSFRCRTCGEAFEDLLPRSDSPAPACPACNAPAPIRLIDAPRAQFRGTGFHATDYGRYRRTPRPRPNE